MLVIQNKLTGELAPLTDKQIAALELLVKRKTSKEISRVLGISPHTVDQRIAFAKKRFGVTSRSELVQAYLAHKRLYEPLTYEESHIAGIVDLRHLSPPDPADADALKAAQQWGKPPSLGSGEADHRVGSGLFDGRFGTLYRLLAIFGLAALVLITVLAMLAIYAELSKMTTK